VADFTRPGALSARILKAIYFLEGEFLEATVGQNPSRTWRSIIEGRDTLAQGLIRRIGTGEQTDIWSSNWLPRDGMMRLVCCVKENPPTEGQRAY
jgi:hypothetical protein